VYSLRSDCNRDFTVVCCDVYIFAGSVNLVAAPTINTSDVTVPKKVLCFTLYYINF